MDNAHSKSKKTIKEQLKEGLIFLGIIFSVIAFFVCAAIYNFDPGLVFQKIFGFITIGAIFIAVFAFIAALLIRVVRWIAGK